MNTSPKFSSDALPGDDWETRRTKEIIRNISLLKEMQGFTTEELRKRCNAFLSEPDRIKVSTLNGLFAGKRKTISATEVEMFASALDVPLQAVLFHPNQPQVEVRPGQCVTPLEAIRHSSALYNFYDPPSPLDLERSTESFLSPAAHCVYLIQLSWFLRGEFYDSMLQLMQAIAANEKNEILDMYAAAVIPDFMALREVREQLRKNNVTPETLPAYYDWVDTIDPRRFTKDQARATFPEWDRARRESEASFSEHTGKLRRKWIRDIHEQK